MITNYPLTALATLAALAVYFSAGILVARARRKYDVRAPAVSGPPGFERAFRAQQNVLEWMPLFLPALWLFALSVSDKWAAALGLIWALARLGYIIAYGADEKKRGPYFFAQLAAFAILWFGAVVGIARTLI
jgi:glutathione S-transferase